MTPFSSLRRRGTSPRRTTHVAHLAVQPLEDRATPATAVYSALTQTLTITAAEGDRIVVAPIANEPTGYIHVTETQAAATVFDSDTTNQGVRNLIVRFNTVNSGGLTLNADVRLGGNLSLAGAKTSQELDLLGTVGGNVTYTAAVGAAFDDLDIAATAHIGGNMALALQAGENTVRLKGGTIRGNLTIAGGAGIDRVEVTADGDINVGGSAAFNLADGNNSVVGINVGLIRVGTNFTFTGGGGNDTFDLDGSGSTLQAGQDARFTLGNPIAFDANLATFEGINVGRNVTFTGGAGGDSVMISGGLLAGGSVIAPLGEGTNAFDSNLLGTGVNSIGVGFAYTGGGGGDSVSLDGTSIGRNVTVVLGESGGAAQAFNAGAKGPSGVTVFGNVKVTGGGGADNVVIHRTYVGAALTVATGAGVDVVGINDVDVAGTSLIDLGAGNDQLLIEMAAGDSGGPLANPTTFGGAVTVRGGDGNDTVSLSSDGSAGTLVHFGARLFLVGGLGTDVANNAAENIFEVIGNTNDFETKTGPALP
jgi:hypothetical protein